MTALQPGLYNTVFGPVCRYSFAMFSETGIMIEQLHNVA